MNKLSIEKIKELQKEAYKVNSQFKACQRYKESKGILRDAKRGVDYYEGRQWLDYKRKLPFENPTLNIVKNIIDGKASSINSKEFKLNFIIDNDQVNTTNVTRFAEYQMKEMGQDEINRDITLEALIKGTAISVYLWNEDAQGQMGVQEGALEHTLVDLEDIAVSNPNEKDIQKQEWVIIRSRESLKYIKEICETITDEEQQKELLHSNQYQSSYTNNYEQDDEEMVYVYTKFFKQDGEVYFEKTTEEILIQKPVSMNPRTTIEKVEKVEESNNPEEKELVDTEEGTYEEEAVNRQQMDSKVEDLSSEEAYTRKHKFNLYPINILTFDARDNCIFGISLAVQIIPIQKAINQLLATNLLSASKSALPTLRVKEGALGTSNIDLSLPGGAIVDRTPIGTWGVDVLNTGTLPTAHYELAQGLIGTLKDVFRATDVLDSGRNIASNTSGYFLQQLTTIQDKPVEQWREMLSRSIKREGRILEVYYKLYYEDKAYSYTLSDAEFLENRQLNPSMETPNQTAMFNGIDYIDTPFNLTVEVGEGAKYSEIVLNATLETLFLNGVVANLAPEHLLMYCELVPNEIFPKKDEFKRMIKQLQQSQISQLQQQNAQLTAQIEQMQIQNQAMQQEFINKVNEYNERLRNNQLDLKALQSRERNVERNMAQGKSQK